MEGSAVTFAGPGSHLFPGLSSSNWVSVWSRGDQQQGEFVFDSTEA